MQAALKLEVQTGGRSPSQSCACVCLRVPACACVLLLILLLQLGWCLSHVLPPPPPLLLLLLSPSPCRRIVPPRPHLLGWARRACRNRRHRPPEGNREEVEPPTQEAVFGDVGSFRQDCYPKARAPTAGLHRVSLT